MKENFDKCFELMLQDEGGYVNDPRDPGGRTNLGVTQRAWEAYLNRSVTETEMRRLTAEDVKTFYKTRYWDKIKGDELPVGVDYVVFDLAVNSGVHKASMTLQSLVGAFADGKIGPKTLDAVAKADVPKLIADVCNMRRDFLKSLSTFAVYGKGWFRRVASVETRADSMV